MCQRFHNKLCGLLRVHFIGRKTLLPFGANWVPRINERISDDGGVDCNKALLLRKLYNKKSSNVALLLCALITGKDGYITIFDEKTCEDTLKVCEMLLKPLLDAIIVAYYCKFQRHYLLGWREAVLVLYPHYCVRQLHCTWLLLHHPHSH